MSNALDLALATMLADYSKNDASQSTVAVVKAASKPRAIKAPKVETVQALKGEATSLPSNGSKPQGAMVAINLPAKGTLDAPAFLVALRKAKDRNEEIQAIAGFVGYDPRENHGTLMMRAKAEAQRMMRPISVSGPSRAEQRSAANSLKGYVAGMPDHRARTLGDLLAREVQTAEARDEHLRQACKTPAKDGSCCMHHAMAEVETERLSHIRADLAKFGK